MWLSTLLSWWDFRLLPMELRNSEIKQAISRALENSAFDFGQGEGDFGRSQFEVVPA